MQKQERTCDVILCKNREQLEALGQCIPPPRHVLPRRDADTELPPKFKHLFIGPLPIPENFMQMRTEVFFAESH